MTCVDPTLPLQVRYTLSLRYVHELSEHRLKPCCLSSQRNVQALPGWNLLSQIGRDHLHDLQGRVVLSAVEQHGVPPVPCRTHLQ